MGETELNELYLFVLKKDLWSELDVLGLLESLKKDDGDRLLFLIDSSVAAGRLIPSCIQSIPVGGKDHTYCFKPSDIINWAISKEIPMPPRLLEWWEKQNKPIGETSAANNQDDINSLSNNFITQIVSKYHPTNGIIVYYGGIGEWCDIVKISKDPNQTDMTKGGLGITATKYFRLSNEDSIDLERIGKVTTNILFPIEPNPNARGQYAFHLAQLETFTKTDIVTSINPDEYKKLCNKYYGDSLGIISNENKTDGETDIEKISTTNNHTNINTDDEPKGRRNKQIKSICDTAKALEYELLNIPKGGKTQIEIKCLENKTLFTKDGFKKAWIEAGKRKLISMEEKEQYF